jgi:hypothetical protein
MLKPAQVVSWLGVFLLLLEQAVGKENNNKKLGTLDLTARKFYKKIEKPTQFLKANLLLQYGTYQFESIADISWNYQKNSVQ